MKRILIFYTVALSLFAVKSNAQYYITSHSFSIGTASVCTTPDLNVTINMYAPSLSVKTYFGDGTASSQSVSVGGGFGYADFTHYYAFPGTYTVKHVLYNGTIPVDSLISSHEYLYCNVLTIKAFNDKTGSGIYDTATDPLITFPITVEVDSNGVVVDTITMVSGLYYEFKGHAGDIYSFKTVSVSAGVTSTFPVGGIIYDTIQPTPNFEKTKYYGFKCTGASGFDLSVNTVIWLRELYNQTDNIYVSNLYCDPTNATVTLNFSPKYTFSGSDPSPTSVSGNTVIWNLTGISTVNPGTIRLEIDNLTHSLLLGDTVHENIRVTPTSGDANPVNNAEIIIDTIKASFDPNEMSVSPSGNIHSGTQLKYTIGFENTGNDTAFNIAVYDTLSDNVDPRSLNLVMASSQMNIAMLTYGGHNIVKFDFPSINLLDSSHHGQCDGAVIFTINPKSGLPDGTTIFNHAGIFFDYNPVVMTDTVENIVCNLCADDVKAISKNNMTIYPNPASDEITIKTDNTAYHVLTITNTIGQLILTQQINTPPTKVNVKTLPAGMYYLTLRGDSGVKVEKFIKL